GWPSASVVVRTRSRLALSLQLGEPLRCFGAKESCNGTSPDCGCERPTSRVFAGRVDRRGRDDRASRRARAAAIHVVLAELRDDGRRRGAGGDVHRHQPERRDPQRRRRRLGSCERAIVHGGRGFSLAEVLVATALLTIGLVAIATGFQYAASGIATGGGETAAVFLAEQRIEQLRARAMTDFSAAALGPGTTTEHCLSGPS